MQIQMVGLILAYYQVSILIVVSIAVNVVDNGLLWKFVAEDTFYFYNVPAFVFKALIFIWHLVEGTQRYP